MDNELTEETDIQTTIEKLKDKFLSELKIIEHDKPSIYRLWYEYIEIYFKKLECLNSKLREIINSNIPDIQMHNILLLYVLQNTELHNIEF